jgi:hypothetical protein
LTIRWAAEKEDLRGDGTLVLLGVSPPKDIELVEIKKAIAI